ncbi:unnamed protein product [Rhizophagus irregularis]|nr:unnamed protein product [Rhizophagus irregularis]
MLFPFDVSKLSSFELSKAGQNYRLIKNAEGQNFFVRSVKEGGNRCIFGTVVEKTQSDSKGVGENKSKKSKIIILRENYLYN